MWALLQAGRQADEDCWWRSRLLLYLSAIAKQAGVHEFDKNSTRWLPQLLRRGRKQRDTFPRLIKGTYPDIEVDFFDESTAVVKVQAQLIQAQSFL